MNTPIRATTTTRSTPCGSGARKLPKNSIWKSFTTATRGRRGKQEPLRGDLQGPLSQRNIYEGKELRFKQHNSSFPAHPGHRAPLQEKNTTTSTFSRRRWPSSQRHAPRAGDRRADDYSVDEENIPWEKAWEITEKTFAYTNHTLLPEALEKWPVHLFEKILPRHLQLIYEINRRFLRQVTSHFLHDTDKLARMSLIEEGREKQVRMANLSVIGSHSINGVAALHTELLKSHVLKDFHEYCPDKFNNKTNGVTQRRWLLKANPGLSKLISSKIGEDWIINLDKLRDLEKFADDKAFRKDFREVKRENKKILAAMIKEETGLTVSPDAIFDVQIKRMHEYKRQLLNILNVIAQYLRLKENPALDVQPRVYIFGGKSAPGYHMAKLIIKLITSVGEVVNNDETIHDKLKVVFYPNYRVSVAEKLFPASDVSEQISTAGMEASGTGNMKFALNGALTIGTQTGPISKSARRSGPRFLPFGNTDEQLDNSRKVYNPGASTTSVRKSRRCSTYQFRFFPARFS
jgi:starch phosphorylase